MQITLLEALQKLFPDSSKSTLRKQLKNKAVVVDGEVKVKADELISTDSEIKIQKKNVNACKEFNILFEDEHLIIIDKPSGLLSVPLDKGSPTSALSILRKCYKSNLIFPAHRIDRRTSGVNLFVKTKEAREGMFELFKRHDLTREYIALVEGKLKEQKGSWESYLFEKPSFEVVVTEDEEQGKKAITHFEMIKSSNKCTWIKLILETGRKHQIRVHAKEAGHPIVGDRRYGSTLNPYRRMCLHAHRIAFIHPITKKKIDIKASRPSFLPSL